MRRAGLWIFRLHGHPPRRQRISRSPSPGDLEGGGGQLPRRLAQVNVRGGPDDDVIRGRAPSRLNFAGNEGDDLLGGSEGPDILRGQEGNDFASGRDGADLLIGDAGDDVLRAGQGRDRLFGGEGADKLDARDRPAFADGVVQCGPGRDLSTLDRPDRPRARDCETLH